MGKLKTAKAKSWEELPLTLTIEQIVEELGYGRSTVDSWFKQKDFPANSLGAQKVEKNLLRAWLYKNNSHGLENILLENDLNEKMNNKIEEFLENFEEKINKICDDLTEKNNKDNEMKVLLRNFADIILEKG